MSTDNEKFWYNLTTGQVERGFESPAIDRAGPFETAEEAAKAPELLRERSQAWAADEAKEDNWGTKAADAVDGDTAEDSK